MSSPETEAPILPMPPVVVALFLVLIGIEAAFGLATRGLIGGPTAVGWRLEAVQAYSFAPNVIDWMVENHRYPADQLIRFVSYTFIHGSFTHAMFAGVILLAMGKFVSVAMGPVSTLIVYFASAFVGATGYWLILDNPAPLIGAYPAVYGLIGTFTYMLWVRLKQTGGQQARAFTLIGFLVGLQLLFGLLFGGANDWLADILGFATGFALSVPLVNGGWAGLLRKIRRD
ncbi:rhomboid family intramembrane serine protease [Pseudoprimorskyibacter insulae]|uniref:Peptidase S54 rhomboid domain-containing protein n=1 Tax=Pseudoprimorskyibacter insulae TaxID=1695997 RepID=A0A2R8ANM5_9RHOB|nr:rhomboid family intramembrane serine protease [Pseudoprimorskyibacter insulae]SPF77623.1 hypothetical protein PRI8871_00207 [Pseudoprimorskyibacter insulae]